MKNRSFKSGDCGIFSYMRNNNINRLCFFIIKPDQKKIYTFCMLIANNQRFTFDQDYCINFSSAVKFL